MQGRAELGPTYDALLEMMRREIIKKELIDHRNRANRVLLPQQRQCGKGPTSYLINYQWKQVGNETAPNSRLTLATTTLNAMITLAYEDATHGTSVQHTRST